eukprot:CAMPEP_0170243830 /NCGR_PEP_ID=MMETSP0116_2-20130129/21692_1 /TAXON_ID=400756 /ORGANISM="Durinskia baltica, Strain CSIRO CS-38" /LENGTH=712 /DNA_ID=CAMNT_0010494687 /DNA_START=118 /DNA_END=2253 /DNA_ORIENTATION=+
MQGGGAEGDTKSVVAGDVEKLASHFKERYETLEKAMKNIGEDVEFDVCSFEAALKKWGVKVDDVVELFGHLDADYNGTVSVDELFSVLELPVQELQQREAQRQKKEVRRHLRAAREESPFDYGSVAEYFAKVFPDGSHADLSIARFRKFATDLGLDLEAAQLQRVFSECDEDGTGSVSLQELQRALNKYLLQAILEEVAGMLMEMHGTVQKAFDTLDAFRRQTSAVAVGMPMPLPPLGEASPGLEAETPKKKGENLTEVNFMRILRELTHQQVDDQARQLYTYLQPISLDDFFKRLSDAEAECQAAKNKLASDRRREREQLRRAAKGFNSRHWAEACVQSWVDSRTGELLEAGGASASAPAALAAAAAAGLLGSESLDLRQPPGVAALPGGLAEDATRREWSAVARAGRSKSQLRDYISGFESRIQQQEEELDKLRVRLQKGQDEAEGLRDFFGPHAPPRTSLDGSPHSPSTPRTPFLTTPGSRPSATPKATLKGRLGVPLTQNAKVLQVERLVQAAATGDVVGVQRALMQVDINAPAWSGATALMAAARHGRIAVLECLLARQADLAQTDMYGRSALDHARAAKYGAATVEWLRSVGAQTGKELAAEAEALARRVLLAKAEEARLKSMIEELPSDEVLRQARLRRQLVQDPTPVAPRPNGSAARPIWPPWSPDASASPELSPYGKSPHGDTPHPTSCLSARSVRGGDGALR